MRELLTDEHLAFLINLYHYFGTGSHLKMFTQEEVKSNLLELPEFLVHEYGVIREAAHFRSEELELIYQLPDSR